MLEELTNKLTQKMDEIGNAITEAIEARSIPFDASQFNDPIALKTKWTPLVGGGTNFRTHILKESRSMLVFKPAAGPLLFSLVFVGFGVLFMVLMSIPFCDPAQSHNRPPIFVFLFPLLFSGVGALMFKAFNTPVIFNQQTGYFSKGSLGFYETPERKGIKVWCQIQDIHALQIISEYISGSDSHYHSYELNIVLKDGERRSVVDHGNLPKLMEDGKKLAMALGVPLWDASSHPNENLFHRR